MESTRAERPAARGGRDPEIISVDETIDSPTATSSADSAIPAQLGSFVPTERLGSGGMGTVFAALDRRLGRTVAIKVVRPDRPNEDRREDRRLLAEAQALARLAHPNVVTVYEVGPLPGGGVFLAMELVRGPTLREWARGRPWRQVVDAYAQVARGLAAAHRAGLVHGDVKPDNALVGVDGRVRVVDFGLAVPARRRDGDEPTVAPVAAAAPAAPVTGDAATVPAMTALPLAGTPAYMAPEQLRGGGIDERSDQFSLCVALYEALYGERPYARDTFLAEPASWPRGRQPRPSNVRARWLYDALERGLSLDPARRFPSLDALVAVLDRERDRARRLVLTAGLAALAASGAAIGGTWLVTRDGQPCRMADDALRGAWGSDARAALRAAHERTGQTWVVHAGSTLVAALDRHAEAWLGSRVAACRATHVERTQSAELLDRRIECLETRRRALGAVAALATAQPTRAAERADDLITSLGDAASCDARGALRDGPPAPPPALAAPVSDARDHAARAEALRVAGDLDGATAALDAASVAAAAARGYTPVRAELDAVAARLAFNRGRHLDGIERSRRAADYALASRQDDLLADVALTLALEAGGRAEHAAVAPHWLDSADAALRRVAAPDDPRWLWLQLAHGRHRIAADRAIEAVAILSTALADAGVRGAPQRDDALRWQARLLQDRGNALARTGAAAAALADYRQAIALLVASLGPDHPKIGCARLALGLHLVEAMHDLDAGERELAEARRIAAGVSAIAVGDAELAQAQLAFYRGDPARAAVHAEAARSNFDASATAGDRRRGRARNALGAARFLVGDPAGAERDYREALALLEAEAPDSHDVGATYFNLAEAALALGRRRAALELARRAEAILLGHPAETGILAQVRQLITAAEAPPRPRSTR
jgi:tetratricopeptide (TPR) repeat protein